MPPPINHSDYLSIEGTRSLVPVVSFTSGFSAYLYLPFSGCFLRQYEIIKISIGLCRKNAHGYLQILLKELVEMFR